MRVLAIAALLLAVMQAPSPAPGKAPDHAASSSQEIQKQANRRDADGNPASPTMPIEGARPATGDADEPSYKDAPNSIVIRKLPTVSIGKDWADWSYWGFGGLLVVVGSLQVFFLGKTLLAITNQAEYMARQTAVAEKAAHAAEKSADAALLNAQALVNAERAWVLVTHDAKPGCDTWIFHFRATNYGKSPAEILWTHCEFIPLDRDEQLAPKASYGMDDAIFLHRTWIPPRTAIDVDQCNAHEIFENYAPDIWADLKNGRKRLWLYGIVRYRDCISQSVHETKFCYWKSPVSGVNLILGGPSGYNHVT